MVIAAVPGGAARGEDAPEGRGPGHVRQGHDVVWGVLMGIPKHITSSDADANEVASFRAKTFPR